jgi:dihydropteroate synthase
MPSSSRGSCVPTLLGVINLSPESMVRESIAHGDQEVLARAAWLAEQGCAIIDLGGRSITPGAAEIDDVQEQSRLLPMVRLLAEKGYPVSADSWSSNTAIAALEHGATTINFTGSALSPALLAAVAKRNARLIITYMPYADAYRMRSSAPILYNIALVTDWLGARVQTARAAGVGDIVTDPNLGIIHESVGNTAKAHMQLGLLWRLDELRSLGCPIMVYAARKPELIGRVMMASAVLHAAPDYVRTHHPDLIRELSTVGTNMHVS